MRLGWDEYRRRAKAFSEEWQDARYEKGETQSFYNDFFEIFGIKRRSVADYERRVQLLNNKQGFIDLFWPGTLLVEQKSATLDLRRAEKQALDYLVGIHPAEQPRFILTCDFQTWILRDRDAAGEPLRFHLKDLHKHITAFDFMLGQKVSFETQAAVTIRAAELMGKLHDGLEETGYTGHDLEQLLVRLLFCLFADDTGIFQPKDIFLQLLENDTRPDGSDVGRVLNDLFDVLDTPEASRQSTLQAELNAFPYVNGRLFAGRLRTPHFTGRMRDQLLDACRHDWSGVSPAIFGSLFQSVMDAKERRAKGAHYTTEANILKVIGPLFLDDLKAELASIVARRTGRDRALSEFLNRLARLTFFDPACGCGNFLVIAYREIRRLELEALKAQYGDQQIDANASLFDFAILTSRAHMAWLGHVGGRMKSDYSYSIGLVYNTFPWPDASPAQREKVEALAQAVLDARAAHPTASLADLYDPDTMPANLRKAHAALDTAVDRLYRPAPFASDRDRVEHLFGRYEALVNPLERIGAAKNRRVARKAKG